MEIESLEELEARNGDLRETVVQGVDLAEVDVSQLRVAGAVFLGCHFASLADEARLRQAGALVFPRIEGIPYDPYRNRLYSWQELQEPVRVGEGPPVTRDLAIYQHFERHGRHLAGVREALTQRLHDHAIDDALGQLLEYDRKGLPSRRAVGIMGGHSTGRDAESFASAAHLAQQLCRAGFFVVTGGGPGIMEAGNLGAYLRDEGQEGVEAALERLRHAPRYTDTGYVEGSLAVLDSFPTGAESLAVPTWFYGHEPSNLFGSSIAKYFSNSIREDGLLALCVYGIVFAPGSAGTTQEIFQDAAQNHYRTFAYRSPMVFLGRERYERVTSIFPTMYRLAEAGGYADKLLLTDDPGEAVEFIQQHPPELQRET